jgi:hypothetical protein
VCAHVPRDVRRPWCWARQHEIDHLDGRLYLSRLGGRVGRRARQAALDADWFGTPSRFVAIA